MPSQSQTKGVQWSSRWIFILAAIGSAIGLGNIWKFPYITGENGGAAFVLVYLICISIVGIPIMIGELLVGRRGRHNPADSYQAVAIESKRSPHWRWAGFIAVASGFLILSFYSVIASWALEYTFLAARGTFTDQSAAEVGNIFSQLLSSPKTMIFWNTLMLGGTVLVIARGVKKGLEKAIQYLLPAMLILLLILVGYSIGEGAFSQGFEFLFSPDFSKLSAEGILVALGHAFFTLSLAMGCIMMYGAYLPKRVSIFRSACIIAIVDTAIALLAGLAIFPVVFANGLPVASGPGLLFQTLPIAFGQMPFGTFFATLFFAMVVFAAFTSTLSLLEPTVAWVVEHKAVSRVKAALISGIILWSLGLASILSFNHWSEITIFGKTFFDFFDYITANLTLPLGGLAVALFVGWFVQQRYLQEELGVGNGKCFHLWYCVLRYITPIAILLVFFSALGII